MNIGVSRVTALHGTHNATCPSPIRTTFVTRRTKTSNVAIRLHRSHHRVASHSIHVLHRALSAHVGLRVTIARRVLTVTIRAGPRFYYLMPRGHRRMAARNNLSITKRHSGVHSTYGHLTSTKVRISLFVSTSRRRVGTTTRINTPFVRVRANYCTSTGASTRRTRRLTHVTGTTAFTTDLNLGIGTNRNLACRGIGTVTTVPRVRRLGVNRTVVNHTIVAKLGSTITRVGHLVLRTHNW